MKVSLPHHIGRVAVGQKPLPLPFPLPSTTVFGRASRRAARPPATETYAPSQASARRLASGVLHGKNQVSLSPDKRLPLPFDGGAVGVQEEIFAPLGLTALAIQVLTGLWMGWIYLPGFQGLFNTANPIGLLVGAKLLLLAGTAALAVHARLRLIPNLTDDNLGGLVWHIRGITALAIAFVVVGALIRLGGLG